ncbi:MAG TPA: ABC transporter permease [Pilimelia sp.]|nr:ABC transporter permease [Pilimelia sp.]
MVIGPEPSIAGERTPLAASPAAADDEVVGEALPGGTAGGGGAPKAIQGRSLWQIAWRRLKRDKVALAGAGVVVFLIVVAVCAPLIVAAFGHPPNEFHQELISQETLVPEGAFGGMSADFPFGVEPVNGRDIFSRVVYGARISLLIAFLATLLSVLIGTTLGVVAGYFGGWIDALISRTMDVFLAFPLLVFAIALAGVIPDAAFGLAGDTLRIAMLVFIIGLFGWPYIGRIVRGQALSVREREFVDAARSLGARGPHIIFREMLPNLVAPILVYATLLIPTNILFEAALSFLGVGIRPPTATWGGMVSDAVNFYTEPHFMFWPGMAIFITVLAFNLFGDGLRDALDPKAR